MLRSARNQIGCSFGRLNARWANTYKENGFEIRNTTNCHYVCFILHNYHEKNKLYIDEEVVKSQIGILKKNEENFKNIPDPIFHLIVVRA